MCALFCEAQINVGVRRNTLRSSLPARKLRVATPFQPLQRAYRARKRSKKKANKTRGQRREFTSIFLPRASDECGRFCLSDPHAERDNTVMDTSAFGSICLVGTNFIRDGQSEECGVNYFARIYRSLRTISDAVSDTVIVVQSLLLLYSKTPSTRRPLTLWSQSSLRIFRFTLFRGEAP